jgi:hypothetical protein
MIRLAVQRELARRRLSVNQAAVLLADIVSRTHLYDWLRGTHGISDDKASLILERLGLAVGHLCPPPSG